MRIRVIGIGTRHGDDAAGLLVAERLASAPLPAGVEVGACEGSPLDLLDALAGADAAILVDATRSGRPPGSVQRVPAAALRSAQPVSSHGLGVAEALGLAEALGQLPPQLELIGVEGGRSAGDAVSPALARGVETACEQVRARVAGLLAAPAA